MHCLYLLFIFVILEKPVAQYIRMSFLDLGIYGQLFLMLILMVLNSWLKTYITVNMD